MKLVNVALQILLKKSESGWDQKLFREAFKKPLIKVNIYKEIKEASRYF